MNKLINNPSTKGGYKKIIDLKTSLRYLKKTTKPIKLVNSKFLINVTSNLNIIVPAPNPIYFRVTNQP